MKIGIDPPLLLSIARILLQHSVSVSGQGKEAVENLGKPFLLSLGEVISTRVTPLAIRVLYNDRHMRLINVKVNIKL